MQAIPQVDLVASNSSHAENILTAQCLHLLKTPSELVHISHASAVMPLSKLCCASDLLYMICLLEMQDTHL
jgi:hypothetical protein